jgi:predicted acylesterase/phospholipase RssA
MEKKIHHLVLSGGGPAGLISYGAIKQLSKQDIWSLDNIKSIYGCSIGAYIGVVISLGYAWEWLDDYIIKRPWSKVVSFNAQTILDAYEQKGLLGEKFILESLKPLLGAKELSEQCTLKELYEFNNIDIHFYTTNINSARLCKVDLSHTTHPELSVIKALCMSTSYPLAFKPVCIDEDCFIDGGLLNNYPLNDCIIQTGCHPDEILAFKNIWLSESEHKVTNESSIIDYMVFLIKKMQHEICTEKNQPDIKHTFNCKVENLSGLSVWLTAVATEEARAELIHSGELQAVQYCKNLPGKI